MKHWQDPLTLTITVTLYPLLRLIADEQILATDTPRPVDDSDIIERPTQF